MNADERHDWQTLVQFKVDGARYALPLSTVERVIRAVAVTPLPKAPAIVLGIIDLAGSVIPVVNVRERFNHQARAMRLSDHLIVAMASTRRVALLVDEASGIVQATSEDCVAAERILPTLEYLDGAVRCPDGLVLIHDLGRLLTLEEQDDTDLALNGITDHVTSASQEPEERRRS